MHEKTGALFLIDSILEETNAAAIGFRILLSIMINIIYSDN